MTTTTIPTEDNLETTMIALIIYDRAAHATKVNAMLARASDRTDVATQWNVKPWRQDLLQLPPLADQALAEATDAHLIVVAESPAEPLPDGVMDWLERWAAQRQVQDAALAVFDGDHRDTLSAPATPGLRRFAERHGLSFIFDHGGPLEDEDLRLASHRHEPEAALPSMRLHLLERVSAIPHQHWGINE